ncbi:MAG: alanine dehydrogenase [Anaerolineae bacterium]|nr:alanine dehydrogenase [Anaerolineae bacterium]MCO5195592.1 alanine dehydrogenase [Anaerolineae bacterium]
MEFGVPKEIRDLESRVSMTPAGVRVLVESGHTVYVEQGAGEGAGFSDESYRRAGATKVYSAAEAYGRADVVVKVTRPTSQEHRLFRPGQMIMCFMHLAVSSSDLLDAFKQAEITAIAFETMREPDGRAPILLTMSEIAGRMAPMIAGRFLMNTRGGRGILLNGIAGVPPADVVIIGGGTLGCNAARAFVGIGAQVTVLDIDLRRLHQIDEMFKGCVTTMLSNRYTLDMTTAFADVVVGCVSAGGGRAPVVVTRDMVSRMHSGSVIIDFSIDMGGCFETSRPTTLRDTVYVAEGITHYCVPNLTAAVARTTSHALNNAIVPFLLTIAEEGLVGSLQRHPELVSGVNYYQGQLSNLEVANALGLPLERALPRGGAA